MRPMSEDAQTNPMRAAQANMRPEPVRRFYRAVDVREDNGRHALTLDGRDARTPSRNPLAAASRPLMLRVAEEWARQGETLDPADMPITKLLNSAIDGVAQKMDETRAEIARYAGSDLVCYRAETPQTLAERQRLAFDPVLDWAAERLGARFVLTAGVMHVDQPPGTIEAVGAALEDLDDPAALASLSVMTTLTGSAVLALATAAGFLSPADAWRAAHVDEDFQNELWGVDEAAMARRAARWREMEAAATTARLLSEL
jgi:chaperone required for assembly of F1-ATPase